MTSKVKLLHGYSIGQILPAQMVPMALGLLLTSVVAATSIFLGDLDWLKGHGFSALTIAIVMGIILGNSVYPQFAQYCGKGVVYSKNTLLRAGIVLYGFRLTFQDVFNVGVSGVLIDAVVLASTFALAIFLGVKVFRLKRELAILIGAGSSICGAAAVLATEPVVKARSEDVTVAVSTVVVFGTLAIFLYPAMYEWNRVWQLMAPDQFGVFIGSTVHEVAQVVAAARAIGPEAANTAVIAKMVRVMMLAPFLLALSVYMSRTKGAGAHKGGHKAGERLSIPWFAFVFIAMVGLNSLSIFSEHVVEEFVQLDIWLLTMAMAALGLTTHVSSIRKAGVKPLMLALVLFGWLISGGALINNMVSGWFA